MATPLAKNIDDVIRSITREENLEGYKTKDGSTVTVSVLLHPNNGVLWMQQGIN